MKNSKMQRPTRREVSIFGIPITERSRVATFPAVCQRSDDAPKGLGTRGDKPLMRNRRRDVCARATGIAGTIWDARSASLPCGKLHNQKTLLRSKAASEGRQKNESGKI